MLRYLTQQDWLRIGLIHAACLVLATLAVTLLVIGEYYEAYATTVSVPAIVSGIIALFLLLEIGVLWAENIWSLNRLRKSKKDGKEDVVLFLTTPLTNFYAGRIRIHM